MLDDSLLDDPAALQRADRDHALLALAGAGARIRTALRQARAAGLAELRPDGRPRGILVAGHGSALTAGQALAALAGTGTLVQPLPPVDALSAALFSDGLSWQLPGWAGPLDLVVLASADGTETGLISLAEQAYARGCAIAVIAPEGRPLAEAALQVRGLPLPYVPSATAEDEAEQPAGAAEPDLPSEDFGAFWAHLTPLLALADRIGVLAAPARELEATADLLDELAVRHRPDAAAYRNPAKDLAAQLAGTVPLLWSEGPVAAVAAERFTAMLADRAGRPAVAGQLPEVLSAHRGMITGRLGAGADAGDFFRDRVDEPDPLAVQVLLLRHTPPEEGTADGGAEGTGNPAEPPSAPEPGPATPTVRRARRLAADHEVRLTELAGTRTLPLHALAELIALTDFAAAYLGLAEQH
ncbi:mannose-6-phosphate isomerase [Kitasatospora sp. NBC_01287]|uniref:SIS domain-containing protein n=1 Tax=Kitasatospora sp. NBC_01287 TaxID=2903573 RepID=UPI00225A4E12|nr:SIS domain-containing protein [Kitasatospora sp. NBC_01287]MCX4748695.1 mannose-6-phosphate isomerase [Kitasatospora sp. NBC_01287]